jgi:hypothetical protein
MKKNKIISGVVAAAALCAVNASAQITYNNGDLLAGFRVASGTGSGTDVIVDLGAINNFQPTAASQSFSGVSSALTSVFGNNLSGVYWSVFGANVTPNSYGLAPNPSVSETDPDTIWVTKPRSNASIQTSAPFVGSDDSQNPVALDILQIGDSTDDSADASDVTPISSDIISITYDSENGYGYSPVIEDSGDANTSGNFGGDWTAVEKKGSGTSDLYQSNPGSSGTATYLGDFVLGSSGSLAFNPVPEPSTWAILGAGLMSLLTVNRYRRNK